MASTRYNAYLPTIGETDYVTQIPAFYDAVGTDIDNLSSVDLNTLIPKIPNSPDPTDLIAKFTADGSVQKTDFTDSDVALQDGTLLQDFLVSVDSNGRLKNSGLSALAGGIVTVLAGLEDTDVDVTNTLTLNDVLVWDGSNWLNTPPASAPFALTDHSHPTEELPTNLAYNNVATPPVQNKLVTVTSSGELTTSAIDSGTGYILASDGGTGRSFLTSNAVLAGNGTGAVKQITAGAAGTVLRGTGSQPNFFKPGLFRTKILGPWDIQENKAPSAKSHGLTSSLVYPICAFIQFTGSINGYASGDRVLVPGTIDRWYESSDPRHSGITVIIDGGSVIVSMTDNTKSSAVFYINTRTGTSRMKVDSTTPAKLYVIVGEIYAI